MTLNKISVVIPAYNEQNAIQATVAEIQAVFKKAKVKDFEIILVNDGSKDKTREIAESLEVTLVNHPHNVGYGRSLKDGIRIAKYETIVITDADLTYPFDQAPFLLTEYQKGFDMVVGARTGAHYRESLIKSPLRKILKFLVEFAANREIPDINSGLRVFHRDTVLTYVDHLCDTFSFTTSMTLAYMMTGKFVTYLPIPYEKREGQTKVKLVKDSLRTLQYILQAINYYNPIKIFMLFAALCILGAIGGFMLSAFAGLQSGFYLGIGGLLVSILIMGLGLVADLLKQIMHKD